jgi:hypothetical protein
MKPIKILMLAAVAWCWVDSTFAQTWTQTSPMSVFMVASSADGKNLVAAVNGGPIFTSTNSGTDWTVTGAPIELWASLASSADGSKLIAATGTTVPVSAIYTSTNSGGNWTTNNIPIYIGFYNWTTVASSADGTKLVAAGIYSPIYTSTNSGATWVSNNSPVLAWHSVASSADGSKLVALDGYADVYTSTNSGTIWTESTNFTSGELGQSVASSADGAKLVVVVYNQGIYISTNSGGSWKQTTAPSIGWSGVASSADGTKLVAVTGGPNVGPIYTSTNSGESWVSNSAPNAQWNWVAASADGDQLVALGGEGIWTAQTTPAPQMNIMAANGNVAISWIIPSTNFVLQQNSDLSLVNWVDVTNTPVLTLTNLHEQVTLSPSNSSGFYRLVTP